MMNNRYVIPAGVLGAMLVFAAPLMAEPLMYVPTGESNELVVIDLATDRIVKRIGELENAHGLSTSPGTEYLVAGSMLWRSPGGEEGAAKPAAIPEAEHQAHHAAEKAPETPTEAGISYVSIVHPQHGHVMRRVAVQGLTHHTAVSPDGATAIAVHSAADRISVINLNRMTVKKVVSTGTTPNYAVFTPDGGRLYISNAGSGTVSEVNPSDWSVARTFHVGMEPEHMALSSGGGVLYVANVGDGTVSAIQLATGETDATYPVGKRPHGVDVSRDGRWLFTSAKGEDRLTRIDLMTGKTRQIDLAPAPYHLEYVDSVGKLYVSSRKAPIIWVLNPQTLETLTTIELGQGVAHQMVVRGQ